MVRAAIVCALIAALRAHAADRIEIALCDDVPTPARVLARSQQVVDRTFNRAGIWVAWVHCASAAVPRAPRVTIRIRLSPERIDPGAPVWVSGRAFRVAGYQHYAEVFYDVLVRYAATAYGVHEGDALGASILHEIGHLLGNPDSRRGVMAQTMEGPERDLLARGRLRFTESETTVMVRELRRRRGEDIGGDMAERR